MTRTNNPYTNKIIEFHILQSFPVTCLNRDDVGAPKTAVVGGVTRARVSSQCWKRAVRTAMHETCGVELGCRTKLLGMLVAKACEKEGASQEKALLCGKKVEGIFGTSKDEEEASKSDTLLFMGSNEVELIAKALKNADFDSNKVFTGKDAKAQAKELAKIIDKPKFVQTQNLDGLDIALFGRMIAQAPSLDVEAAASFSHAISTHKVTNQIEFFTALDDFSKEQGSAHMGSLEFNAATYYRYICLDLGQLYETLAGDAFFDQAITAFIKALYVAVPEARQTTQSGYCLWDYANILVRKGQGVQLSFDKPVKAKDAGMLEPSIEILKKDIAKKEKISGSLFGKLAQFEFGIDENFSIDNLIDSVIKAVKA